MYKYVGAVDVVWEKHPVKAKRRKGASPTDGTRGPIYKDVKFGPVPLSSRVKQLVFPYAEAGDGIFIYPN